MIDFKKKDVIEHPNYGRGVITKVRVVHDALTILDVDFKKEGIIKQLNAAWVENNCKHIKYIPEVKPKFKDGVYSEDVSLSTEKWRVLLEEDTVVDEKVKEGLRYILKNVTPGINLALVGWFTVVAIDPAEGSSNEEIERIAKKHMTGVFCSHPDFRFIELQDKGIVITMRDDHLWIFIPSQYVKRDKNGEVLLSTMLAGRNAIMAECSGKKIYAIIRGV